MGTPLSAETGGTGAETALSIRNLSKAFPGTLALDRVSLDIRPGEIHALVGHNGSGKSTLIKILSGTETPDPGSEITVKGKALPASSPHESFLAGCRFVHQDLGLVDAFSVADNISLVGGWSTRMATIQNAKTRRRAVDALATLGLAIDPDRLVSELSPAQRTGVAVARALQHDDRAETALLVLDEPTATLPLAEVEKLHELIRTVAAQGVAVLFVSHRLEEVLELSNRVTVFRNGKNVFTRPTGELSHADIVTAMLGFELKQVVAPAADERKERSAGPIFEVAGLSSHVLRNINFELYAGEIVGIAGIEGSGRDDLFPALFGALERHGGTVSVRGATIEEIGPRASIRAGISYVPADREHLASLPGLSARENVTVADLPSITRAGAVRRGAEKAEVNAWFERLDVRPSNALEASFESFSGGNRQKLVLARALRCDPAVMLLEEPSQGVDVGAQARLHREIIDFAERGGGVLVSSADAEELSRLCGRVMVIRGGQIVAELRSDQISDSSISHALFAGTEVHA
ncbi:MAG: sugar ABC transporter ATP-binding protein [Actinobacteria bacterium]|nr:sugar ABC transporter ATP-binding protein [Actinomycetota bacterium]